MLILLGAPLVAQDSTRSRATVSYLSGNLAYLTAGRDQGLREGAEVRVIRNGVDLGPMVVRFLASQRAACELGSLAGIVTVGDTVEYAAAAAEDPAEPEGTPAATSSPRSARGLRAVRGRVGLRYLMVVSPEGTGYWQPGLDARFEGYDLGGAPIGLFADIRARNTRTVRPDGSVTRETRTGVYQLAAIAGTRNGPVRMTLGRQYLPTMASVSLFDGALAEYRAPGWGVGVFGGTEPEPYTLAFDDAIRHYGLYLQGRSSADRLVRWTITGGAVGSYAGGDVNREFGFLQASLAGRHYSFFAAAELDLNRGWKREAGEPQLSLTSSYLAVSASPASWLSVNAGLDNRRNVRLYRDHESPETLFDDAFRQGLWGGVWLRGGRHLRFGADARVTTGGLDSTARTRTVTGSIAADQLTRAGLGFRGRWTTYDGGRGNGWLGSGAVGMRPAPWFGVELTGGRRLDRPVGQEATRRTAWFGVDADVGIGRAWYLLFSWSREHGDLAVGDQLYGGLTWRF